MVQLPRASARAERQRYVLRQWSHAGRAERRRSELDPVSVILAALVSRLAPVSLAGGWVQEHTGLTRAQTATALRQLEAEGIVAPGSVASGRCDFATPAALSVWGVPDGLVLPYDVLPDHPAVAGGVADEVRDLSGWSLEDRE